VHHPTHLVRPTHQRSIKVGFFYKSGQQQSSNLPYHKLHVYYQGSLKTSEFYTSLQFNYMQFATPPARTARSSSYSRRKPKKNTNEGPDDLMREIDALEGKSGGGFYSMTSPFLKAPPKPDTVLGNNYGDDVSSIGSEEDEDDDEMILSTPNSQGTHQSYFFFTPNSREKKPRSYSLTPRKTNEVSLLSVSEVTPMTGITAVPPPHLKRKRYSTNMTPLRPLGPCI